MALDLPTKAIKEIPGVKLFGSSGYEVDVDSSGNIKINGDVSATFPSVQSVQFDAAQSVNATLVGTSTVQFPSAQSVQFDSTQNVSAVFPSAQDININGAIVAVGRVPQLGSYDAAVAYKYNTYAVAYDSGIDATEYIQSTATVEEEVKDYGTFTISDYDSGFNTSNLRVKLNGEIRRETGGSNIVWVKLMKDGAQSGTQPEDGYESTTNETYEAFEIYRDMDASGTDDITVNIDGTSSKCYVKNLRLTILNPFDDSSILPANLGTTKLFLKAVTLEAEEGIKLNNNASQTIANPTGGATTTYSYENPVEVSQINIIAGEPVLSLLGAN